jgi:hypothetical protein
MVGVFAAAALEVLRDFTFLSIADPAGLNHRGGGFPRNNERKLGRMLMFRDVSND